MARTARTHVITSNGRTKFEAGGPQPAEVMITRALERMDGVKLFAVSLARLPEGLGLGDRLPKSWPSSYLQSAGTAEAMTIEMRSATSPMGAEAEHVVVGRAGGTDGSPVTVVWNDGHGSQVVAANEAFAADEAARVYLHYYAHDTIPEGYVARPL